MKRKADIDKIIGVIGTFLVMLGGILLVCMMDTLKPTREELTNFYKEEFKNNRIDTVIERKYPGKGYYSLFSVDTKTDYYPILLSGSVYTEYNLFKKGGIINKASNSCDIKLEIENKVYSIKIEDSKDEDDRRLGITVCVMFCGLIIIVLLILPNSYYENRRKKKTAHNTVI